MQITQANTIEKRNIFKTDAGKTGSLYAKKKLDYYLRGCKKLIHHGSNFLSDAWIYNVYSLEHRQNYKSKQSFPRLI